MQLKRIFTLVMFAVHISGSAQQAGSSGPTSIASGIINGKTETTGLKSDSSKVDLDDIDITFLSSYYEQDGNHAAVTGGTGTEYLNNIAPSVIINFPVDTVRSLSLLGGVDYYSSASSDNIDNPALDPDHVSGESSSDLRGYATLGYKVKNKSKSTEKGVSLGFSKEFDVVSGQIGASWGKASKDNNRSISLKGSYYYDNWKLIAPIELRETTNYATNVRHTGSISLTGVTVLNTRMKMSLTSDLTVQQGLLSTPFHRVYFIDEALARVENLPDFRYKIPTAIRLNYAISSDVIFRSFYRYYWDNWGVQGHSMKVELPIKIRKVFKVYPFYRYHVQSAADYFQSFQAHVSGTEFYTSDHDLSAFTTHKYGAGIKWSPFEGIGNWNTPWKKGYKSYFKSIEFRYAHFNRSDGLEADIFTLALQFRLAR